MLCEGLDWSDRSGVTEVKLGVSQGKTQSDEEQTISCCRRPVSVLQPCKSDFSDAVFWSVWTF